MLSKRVVLADCDALFCRGLWLKTLRCGKIAAQKQGLKKRFGPTSLPGDFGAVYKAYDSVRWDYLNDVLVAFRFGSKWCQWIRGTFCFAKASILVNGSPSNEFQFHCGLKQGDPLAPLLFILVMKSLHLSFCRVVQAGMFKGIRLNSSISVSHLFYADDALIIGEWSSDNLCGIINVLKCFYLASGLQITIHKSQLLGVGVPKSEVESAASSIGCSIMNNQFRYLGVMVGENMARHKAWVDVVLKLKFRLSK
ncbi:RNA-directed DNA polymerase, eukaryota [Tanacetum coccineum]